MLTNASPHHNQASLWAVNAGLAHATITALLAVAAEDREAVSGWFASGTTAQLRRHWLLSSSG